MFFSFFTAGPGEIINKNYFYYSNELLQPPAIDTVIYCDALRIQTPAQNRIESCNPILRIGMDPGNPFLKTYLDSYIFLQMSHSTRFCISSTTPSVFVDANVFRNTWILLEKDANGTSSKHVLPNGGEQWWFTKKHEPRKKKTLFLSIESWLVNRDPYNGSWNNPYIPEFRPEYSWNELHYGPASAWPQSPNPYIFE